MCKKLTFVTWSNTNNELDISDNGLVNKCVHHYVVDIVSYCRTLGKQYSLITMSLNY